MKEAVAAGVSHIDTAHSYTQGESEEAIGAALSPFVDGVVVATKGGYRAGEGRPEVLRADRAESSPAADQQHRGLLPAPGRSETTLEQSLGTIAENQRSGKIRHVGLSEVGVEQIERAREVVVPFFPLRGDGGRPLAEIARRHGATPAQITLAWLLRRSPATLPIPGTPSLDHLRENLAALEIELSDADFDALS